MQTAGDGGGSTACVLCRTPIPVGAKICTACKSSQSRTWRGVERTASGIAVIGTVVPLLVGAFTFAALVFDVHRPSIELLPVLCGAESIKVAAFNNGTGAGVVGLDGFDVVRDAEKKTNEPGFNVRIEQKDANGGTPADRMLMKPGEAVLISLIARLGDNSAPFPRRLDSQQCIFELSFHVYGFGSVSARQPRRMECNCPQ